MKIKGELLNNRFGQIVREIFGLTALEICCAVIIWTVYFGISMTDEKVIIYAIEIYVFA